MYFKENQMLCENFYLKLKNCQNYFFFMNCCGFTLFEFEKYILLYVLTNQSWSHVLVKLGIEVSGSLLNSHKRSLVSGYDQKAFRLLQRRPAIFRERTGFWRLHVQVINHCQENKRLRLSQG